MTKSSDNLINETERIMKTNNCIYQIKIAMNCHFQPIFIFLKFIYNKISIYYLLRNVANDSLRL